MRPRHTAPEVVPGPPDIEGGGNSYGKTISMAGSGGRPIIQPFEGYGSDAKSKGKRSGLTADKDFLQKVAMGIAGIWLVGWLLMGWDLMWPLYIVFDIFGYFLSFPPFSWLSWIFGGWSSRGAPLLNNGQHVEEVTLPQSQVSQYADSYVQQYGDAALIFSTHDGYPQIVRELLQNEDMGYRDLLDARDDSGNTALIYAAAKGFRLCTAALLRAGADPELRNEGNGGRTPLMEAAGGGYKDIVGALRMMPNVSVDLTDDHGNTALHYAAYHGHLPVVMEILKSNPNKEIKNIYGHTAASYAASQKFKGVADVLNRADPARSQRRAMEKEKADEDAAKAIQDKIKEHLEAIKAKEEKGSKHVKGKAADLHDKDFEPALEHGADRVSDAERKALEEQLTKMRRQHEEAELKSQKRIVELLEKQAEQQKALDEAKAIITATASVLGSCLCPPLMEALKLQWRLKSAMATMLLVQLVAFSIFAASLPDSPVAVWKEGPASPAWLMTWLVVASVAEGAVAPMVYELSAELTYPHSEGLTGAAFSSLLNFFGFVLLGIFPLVPPRYDSLMMMGACLVSLVLLCFVHAEYPRRMLDENVRSGLLPSA